ncbi:SMR family transporter [Thioclava sp. GXIMD2076]|uniref:SMR family transporter n=1 Tax=Thioclava kandeliae TaxID=3070818 RepID=A0ABV1SGN7_9RHOB
MKTYGLLLLAVLFEVFGTSCLQASQQFSRLWPSLGVLAGFAGAFFLLTQVLKTLPLGLTYALWSGIGIVLTSIIGLVIFKQRLDFAAICGIGLIIAGVLVINLLSKSAVH